MRSSLFPHDPAPGALEGPHQRIGKRQPQPHQVPVRIVKRLPHYGNLTIIDARSRINIEKLAPDFDELSVDPYVPEGFRRKHIAWFKRSESSEGLERLPNFPLLQSSQFNPIHGDLSREYPALSPRDHETMVNLVELFANQAQVPPGETILMQYQRITCNLDLAGEPSVEGWHRDGVTRIGILVTARDGIEGGSNQFRIHRENDGSSGDGVEFLQVDLTPGQMAIFEDAPVRHRVTPIHVEAGRVSGYRDVVLFSYGGQMAP